MDLVKNESKNIDCVISILAHIVFHNKTRFYIDIDKEVVDWCENLAITMFKTLSILTRIISLYLASHLIVSRFYCKLNPNKNLIQIICLSLQTQNSIKFLLKASLNTISLFMININIKYLSVLSPYLMDSLIINLDHSDSYTRYFSYYCIQKMLYLDSDSKTHKKINFKIETTTKIEKFIKYYSVQKFNNHFHYYFPFQFCERLYPSSRYQPHLV
ncbi:hypothetical protein HZS_1250 [Henneguya salminicola]|nr:hypothetical protein HZS_1250 [Henneguya salminicola]